MLPGQYVTHEGRPAQLSRTLCDSTVGQAGAIVKGVRYELVQDGRYVYVRVLDGEVQESAPARSAAQVGVTNQGVHPKLLPECQVHSCRAPAGYPCDHMAERAAQ